MPFTRSKNNTHITEMNLILKKLKDVERNVKSLKLRVKILEDSNKNNKEKGEVIIIDTPSPAAKKSKTRENTAGVESNEVEEIKGDLVANAKRNGKRKAVNSEEIPCKVKSGSESNSRSSNFNQSSVANSNRHRSNSARKVTSTTPMSKKDLPPTPFKLIKSGPKRSKKIVTGQPAAGAEPSIFTPMSNQSEDVHSKSQPHLKSVSHNILERHLPESNSTDQDDLSTSEDDSSHELFNKVDTSRTPNKKVIKSPTTSSKRDSPFTTSIYTCQFCKIIFKHDHSLKMHLRKHWSVRDLCCQFCEKGFFRKDHLIIHERVHTGVRPYKCKSCPQSFKTKSHLNRHVEKHTDETTYSCSYCSKNFWQKQAFQSHIRIHTGETPYECFMCDRTFGTSRQLLNHKRGEHTEDEMIHTGG